MYSTQIGKVLKLYISKSEKKTRNERERIFVDESGVVDDKFYGRDTKRSILIATKDSYDMAKNVGIDTPYSSLGENILIDFNPYSLDVGTHMKIGDTILEITQHCTLCKSLTKVDPKLPKLLKDDRGIFAKVIKSGYIFIDDAIYIDNHNTKG